MICTLTARRVRPGGFDDFRQAWMGDDEDIPAEVRERWKTVYVCRDVSDPDVVLTFGFFQGTLEELREMQARFNYDEQVARIEPHIEGVLFDGSFEVVEELTPESVA